MAYVRFTAVCKAYYKSSLEIPDELAKERDYEKIAKYVRDNLADAEIEDSLEYLEDIEDSVTAEDIWDVYIEK